MSTVESLGTKRFDPYLRDLDLPLRATFFPVGFRLNIATNSRDVLEAAAPPHVDSVRGNLIDLLTPAEVKALDRITGKVVDHLQPGGG